MKKLIIVTVLVLASLPLSAMTHDKYSVFHSYGDKVNVRKKPDLNSEIIYQLKLGEGFFILKKEDVTLSVDGYSDSWYKILPLTKDSTFTGYVWGGFIANQSLEIDYNGDGRDELLLLRNFTEGVYSDITGQTRNLTDKKDNLILKVISSGKILETVNLPEHGETGVASFQALNNAGFGPKIKLFLISYGCVGETFGDYQNLYVYDKGLKPVCSLFSGGEGGSYTKSELIFPNDKDGKKGMIRVRITDSGVDIKNTVNYEEYIWSASQKTFVKK